MTSVHDVLSSLFGEPHSVIPGQLLEPDEIIPWFLFGRKEALVAMGTSPEGHILLGLPRLIWAHPNIPAWSMKPVWTVPPEWDAHLTDEQCAELSAQAQAIAATRQAEFLRCQSCGTLKIPEQIDPEFNGQHTCHGCMEQQGVVF